MKQLSGQDAMWIHLETNKTPMHIGVLYVFDSPGKKFDFKDFKQFFEDRLHLSRIFRQRLVEAPMGIGSPFWADDPDFDINHHMFHVALPKPGGRKLLKELAARHYSPPLDRTRPLWKATFITDINIPELSEDAFAMLVQVHHAAIDGKSGVEIMASILSMTEEPFVPA
ncbi:MAG: wax ester/triacylglycerol synthase domain-containing protein, partial [Saprospiraceae bacterium]